MRRNIVPLSIAAAIIIVAVGTFLINFRGESNQMQAVGGVTRAPSQIYARMLIRYDQPPLYEEEWSMQDVEGVSTYQYRVRSYAGKQITIKARADQIHDVSYWWGKLDRDGVWQIVNQPPRGNTHAAYTVYVKQLIDFKQGERTVTFTDPHYWATTAGHQYSLDLSKQNASDGVQLKSSEVMDSRYQTVVDDFLTFGSDEFRRKIDAARAQARSGS